MQRATFLGTACAGMALSVGLCGAAHAASQSVDLGLSNEVVTAGYAYEVRPDAFAQAQFLHSNSNHHQSNLLSVGLGVTGMATPIVKPRIGAKVFLLDGKHVNGHGLAVDAGAAITVAPRVVVDVSAAYAPDIVTSGDIDRYYDLGVNVGYEIFPSALVYAGFKDVQGKHSPSDYEIYQGVVVGFKMSF